MDLSRRKTLELSATALAAFSVGAAVSSTKATVTLRLPGKVVPGITPVSSASPSPATRPSGA